MITVQGGPERHTLKASLTPLSTRRVQRQQVGRLTSRRDSTALQAQARFQRSRRLSDLRVRLTTASGRNDRRRGWLGRRVRDGKDAHCSNVAASGVGNAVFAQRLTLVGACARGSVSRATAGAPLRPRPRPRTAGRAAVEEAESSTEAGGCGGQFLEAKSLTAPSSGLESSRVTDPRAGSEARRCWCKFRQRSRRARTGAHGFKRGREQRCLGWFGSNGRRATHRRENVLDSAGDRVDTCGKAGKLAHGCAERAQIVGARHVDTSISRQLKGATKARAITTGEIDRNLFFVSVMMMRRSTMLMRGA